MTPQIIEKLQNEVSSGLHTEAQVVYFLAGVRKIIEQDNLSRQYEYLKFHCDWALHAKLKGNFAQKIINHFDNFHSKLIDKKELRSSDEADKISKMNRFQEEMSCFLRQHSISDFSQNPNSWPDFIYQYARVIEDCPLIIRTDNLAQVKKVVVSVEMAKQTVENHTFFKVSWRITDKNDQSGEIYVIHSFEKSMSP